jgi:hypothetical protein
LTRTPTLPKQKHTAKNGGNVKDVRNYAFEDFLTREIVDGRNIVDDYLKRRGWRESASTKAYMRALRNSVISLYEMRSNDGKMGGHQKAF